MENRCRFVLEIADAISKTVGENKTAIRLSPFSKFQGMSDTDPMDLYSHLLQGFSKVHPNLAFIHFTDSMATPDEITKTGTLRKEWVGKCINNRTDYTREQAIQDVENGMADLTAFGRDFIANPDLPIRLMNNLPLNQYDPSTFYTAGEQGYTDYPFYGKNY